MNFFKQIKKSYKYSKDINLQLYEVVYENNALFYFRSLTINLAQFVSVRRSTQFHVQVLHL